MAIGKALCPGNLNGYGIRVAGAIDVCEEFRKARSERDALTNALASMTVDRDGWKHKYNGMKVDRDKWREKHIQCVKDSKHPNQQTWKAHWCASRETTCVVEDICMGFSICRYPFAPECGSGTHHP